MKCQINYYIASRNGAEVQETPRWYEKIKCNEEGTRWNV